MGRNKRFDKVITVHVEQDHFDFVYGMSKTNEVSMSAILREMIAVYKIAIETRLDESEQE